MPHRLSRYRPGRARGRKLRDRRPDQTARQAPRAFACLAGDLPELLLALVGPVSARLADELGALGASLGLDGRVFVTGRVTAEAYLGWLNRAELSVQLRASFSGEASAAVGDCLAAGVPMIVSDLGWMEELPDNVAYKIGVDASPAELAAAMRSPR